jgi:hypothetical protein
MGLAFTQAFLSETCCCFLLLLLNLRRHRYCCCAAFSQISFYLAKVSFPLLGQNRDKLLLARYQREIHMSRNLSSNLLLARQASSFDNIKFGRIPSYYPVVAFKVRTTCYLSSRLPSVIKFKEFLKVKCLPVLVNGRKRKLLSRPVVVGILLSRRRCILANCVCEGVKAT